MVKLFLFILLPFSPVTAFAQAEIDDRFICEAQDRILTDEDFVRLALGYELEKMRAGYPYDTALPEGYEIGSVDGFLERNPDSYTVDRDPKAWRNQSRSWLARFEDWLDGETIFIGLYLPSVTVGRAMIEMYYLTDECGELKDDRYFSFSNRITE